MNTVHKIVLLIIIAAVSFTTTVGGGKKIAGQLHVSHTKKQVGHRATYSVRPLPDKRTNIYLTIDDGPSAASFYLNNMIVADSVYLTMFVIGDSVFQNKGNSIFYELYRLNPFVEIGNHSYSHANGRYQQYYQNSPNVIEDFCRNADTLHIPHKIARMPGRNTWRINGRQRTDLADDTASADGLALKGYRVFGWDIEWKYKKDSIQSADTLMAAIDKMNSRKNSFTPGNIVILCHESMFMKPANRIQFDRLVKRLRQSPRYQMRTLSQYPAVNYQLAN